MLGAAAVAGAALLPRLARSESLMRISGRAFGTTWTVLLPQAADVGGIARSIDRLLESLDAIMSPFRPDSELSRFNSRRDAKTRTRLSRPMADVVGEALRIARITGGAFDPTVGPAVARFGFGPIRAPLAPAENSLDYRGFALSNDTVIRKEKGLTFDPCGIGKGYALDEMGRLLAKEGIDSFFAEFGGEILARGRHPSGRPWRAGIEQPVPGPRRLRHAVTIAEGALATSGDRVNAYDIGGRRYGHIVDPRTAAPVNNGVASVSVMAPTAMTADALATALMVMGPDEGLAFADGAALPVLFVMHDGKDHRDMANEAFRAAMIA